MTNLSEPFIRKPVLTSLFISTIIFFGIISYLGMPVSDLPSIDYPTIQVTTSYPGADPETVANTVTSPLERQLSTIENVQTLASTSSNGNSTIVLMFGLDKSLDAAATDVQSAINQAMAYLPSDLPSNPTYTKVNPSSTPILVYSLSSNIETRGTIYDYGYSLFSNRLSMVNGVSQVQVYGPAYAVRVQVDPDELVAKNISLQEVADMISASNPDLPTGTLYGPKKEYNINVQGQILSADGYNELVVRNKDGAMVKLKEVGRALDSLQDDKMSLMYYDHTSSAPGVVLAIRKQAGFNTVQVAKNINDLLPDLLKDLPSTIQFNTIFDQSGWIFESVDDVEFTLIIAFILVGLVTLFYLGKTIDTIIPVVVLPITILGTFICMYIIGFSIDILSLLAITLAIGFLIDDAIVVLENIVRHVEMGKPRLEAALEGSKQISFTVLSTTASLISVFIPMLFMSGIIGRIFREFAATIMIAVAISGIIALTLTPLLCSRFLTENNKEKKKNWIEKCSEKINHSMIHYYEKGLNVILRHKILTIFLGIISVFASAMLFKSMPKDFLPPDDLGFIQGFAVMQDGTSPFETMRALDQISSTIQNNPNVKQVVLIGAQPYDNQSIFYIGLKDIKEREPIEVVMQEIYKEVAPIPGISIFMKSFPLINLDIGTQVNKGQYQYALQSFHQEDLYKYAPQFINRMRSLPGFKHVVSDLDIDEPQINITIDRDMASSFNVTAQAIEKSLMYAYGGTKISLMNTPLNQYYIILETLPSAYKDPTMLNKIYVPDSGGNLVPLNQMTHWESTVGPLTVNHINTMPSVLISFDLEDIPLSTALTELDSLAGEILPPNVSRQLFGSASSFLQTFQDLIFLLLIAFFVIYVILGILYENFIHPITVMSTLPPAALSGLVTLLIFGQTISLYAFVGFIMLLGIVMKNGIILIDFANEALLTGKYTDPEEAIRYSAVTRFRPIIMTTFSTLMGALPIALGIGGLTAESRQPVGLVIVGGLLFSQLLTLFLTPVTYIYMERMRQSFKKRFNKKESKPQISS